MERKVLEEIIDSNGLQRTITRLAHEMIERNKGADDLAIVGVQTRGAILAKRLVDKINDIEKSDVPLGILDITFYRDDFRQRLKQPSVQKTDILFDIDNKHIILVDDVLFTGRTTRAALDALMDLGRPASIQFAVMVDRGHREMPIHADYVGRQITTAIGEEIQVKLTETDNQDCVLLVEAPKQEV